MSCALISARPPIFWGVSHSRRRRAPGQFTEDALSSHQRTCMSLHVFKISSTSELIKVLKLRAFSSLTCLDFGKHGRCFSQQCTSRNCVFADFPRLTSGKTTWKQLKKICPKIVRLRVGSIKNVSANISKIIDAFGPQLVEFQIKEDFKATSRTFLQICEGMPKLESLTLASAPNVWAHGWRVAKSSGVEYFNNPTLCFSAMSHLQYLRHIDFSLENWMPESYSDPTLNSCFDVLRNAGGIPTLERANWTTSTK